MAKKNISIKIDEITLEKLRYIARYYDRSLSNQVLVLIRQYIEAYETRKNDSNENLNAD